MPLSDFNLSFGPVQIAVLGVFLILSVCVIAVFLTVAAHSQKNMAYEEVTRPGYRMRRGWLIFLIVVLGVGVIASLSLAPYSRGAEPTMTVKVSGYQFNWTVTPASAPVGSTVEFEVTSVDVNHGIGFYDPAGVLIGNVQAMPDRTNRVRIPMDKPGAYTLACLEFCGVGHHRMVRTFEVTQ